MKEVKKAPGTPKNLVKISIQHKYLVFTLFVLALIVLFSGGFGLVYFLQERVSELDGFQFENRNCGDGTASNSCSTIKPFFCLNGNLVENASACGCYEKQIMQGQFCVSIYHTFPKEISLKYVLNGEVDYINLVVYEGFANYVYGISKSISYSNGDFPSRVDFKLKSINEEEQRKMLLPLVAKIQDITPDKEDQARIAISLVQNIPYGNSDEKFVFGNSVIDYSRYPYEVLYDKQGICGEKTELLAFLLKEMGYGVSFFYYSEENHEALGIKCPVKESLEKSGYCFVETTGPAILTDNQIYYKGVGKLQSIPEIYLISEGESIGENLQEYSDAKRLIQIRNSIEKDGLIGPINKIILEGINKKYGLGEEYYR